MESAKDPGLVPLMVCFPSLSQTPAHILFHGTPEVPSVITDLLIETVP